MRNFRHERKLLLQRKEKSTTKFCVLKLYRDLGNATDHRNWGITKKEFKEVDNQGGCV